MNHEEMARLLDKYRAAAQQFNRPYFKVTDTASVTPVEDGAFVEAVIFIPKNMLEEKK